MDILKTAGPPNVIPAIDSTNLNVFPKAPPEVDITLSNDLHSSGPSNTKHVSAVFYNPTEYQELQHLSHTVIKMTTQNS